MKRSLVETKMGYLTLFLVILFVEFCVIVAQDVNLNSFVESVEGTKIKSKPGRHVCTTQKTISRPIPVIQQYRKPVYTPKPRDCPNISTCPQFDVSYTLANRTVYQLQKSSTFDLNCCPGWTKGDKREKGCMQPICKNGCGDFGDCVKPEQCECRQGFTGPLCDTDIDECLTNNHGCQHQCKNTAGSYLCACQEGFNLAPDGRTCIFCFTCQKEYQDLLSKIAALSHNPRPSIEYSSEIQTLNSTIRQLQEELLQIWVENNKLTEQVNELQAQQENANFEITVLQNLTRTTTSAPTTSTTTTTRPTTTTTTTTPTTTTTSSSTTTTTPSTTTSTTPTTTTTRTTTPLTTEPKTEPGLQFDTYDLIISLSNQIGLMEEKLELCQCTYRGGRGYG